MTGNDEVGYGKPPESGRFKKGRSGNPRGRPKGTRNLTADLMAELQETVAVREGDKSTRISKQRAVVKSLVAGTIKGDRKAATILLAMVNRLLDQSTMPDSHEALDPDDQAIIAAALARKLESDEESDAAPQPPSPVE